MRIVRYMANAFAVGFYTGLGTEKGDALWHGKSGEKADWIPTTGIEDGLPYRGWVKPYSGTVIPTTPPVGWQQERREVMQYAQLSAFRRWCAGGRFPCRSGAGFNAS